MKPLLLIPILSLPLLFSACDTLVVASTPRRTAYVERDYDRHDHRYDRRDDRRDDRYDRYDRRRTAEVLVVNPSPAYRPQATVRYYSDTRGRYYIRDGRRIYSNAGVVRY